jgi:DNA-binding HxlR family transcriptional regulator
MLCQSTDRFNFVGGDAQNAVIPRHIRHRAKAINDQNCSIAQAVEVLGDWWTLLVVRKAFVGTRRFARFEETWTSRRTS